MPTKETRLVLPYEKAEQYIQDGDVLLYRGRGLVSRAIRTAGRSRYSHAAMAGWANGDYNTLMCYEVREWAGGRVSSLRFQAEKYGGYIDVFRPARQHTILQFDPDTQSTIALPVNFEPELAIHVMRQFARPGEYGWGNIITSSLLHLPVVRWVYQQPADDLLERKQPPYCSQAVAYALRRALADVVLNTPDCFTEPGDLARSPLLHYMHTLGPPTLAV